MKFYDFIGNEITIGSFCAYPGAGNVKAEYGMILYKITGFDISTGKVKAVRLHAAYGVGVNRDQLHKSFLKNAIFTTDSIKDVEYVMSIQFINYSLENTNKLAVVNVPDNVQVIFNKILNGDKSVFDIISGKELSHWILGSVHCGNPFNKK